MGEETVHPHDKADGNVPDKLIGVKDIAQYLGLSVHTVYTMVSQGRIPYVKVGRLTRFDMRSIHGWTKQHFVHPRRPTRNGA